MTEDPGFQQSSVAGKGLLEAVLRLKGAGSVNEEDFSGDGFSLDPEIEERVAVLRRYRSLLEEQRGRLQTYLELVDVRDAAVRRGDFEHLEDYTQQEQEVLRGILETQRCIEPFVLMYKKAVPEGSRDIEELEQRLESLRDRILARNEENIALLKTHMVSLKGEIQSLNVPRDRGSVYGKSVGPQMIDILS